MLSSFARGCNPDMPPDEDAFCRSFLDVCQTYFWKKFSVRLVIPLEFGEGALRSVFQERGDVVLRLPDTMSAPSIDLCRNTPLVVKGNRFWAFGAKMGWLHSDLRKVFVRIADDIDDALYRSSLPSSKCLYNVVIYDSCPDFFYHLLLSEGKDDTSEYIEEYVDDLGYI